jgi:lipoprotein-releasing system permease protein
MPLKFEWIVALRFLREGKLQTLFIIGGAAIGVGLIVLITGIITSLQKDLIARTLGTQAHVVISPVDEINRPQLGSGGGVASLPRVQARAQRLRSIDQWQKLMRDLESVESLVAISPTVAGAGLALRGEASRAVQLIGIEPERYVRVTHFDEKIVAGALRLNSDECLIGIQLAKDLGVGVGDKIRLQTANQQSDAFTVRGLFDLGNRDANRRSVYLNFHTAQSLLDLVGGVSNLDIAVADVFDADRAATLVAARTDQKVESWMQTNSQLFIALSNQTFMTRLIRIFVAVIVAVGITSVLVVSVVQKQREIGILRAMGAARGAILRVFLLQGAIIGVIGAVFGSALGTALMALVSKVLKAPDGSPFVKLSFGAELYVGAVVVALVFGVLAAAVPARRAAGLDPAQAIRV